MPWRVRLFLAFWSILWTAGQPLIRRYLSKRAQDDPDYGRWEAERRGIYADTLKGAVWIHAVSLGEVRSAVPLARALLARGERVLFTHFTPAGRRETQRVFGPEIADGRVQVVWVPYERAACFKRFFAAFRPKYGLVMEVEIWPRMIWAARSAGVSLMLCNAQYPSRSMVRDAKWVALGLRHAIMRGVAGALVKSELQAERFASVGVQNIFVTGELRFDQPVPGWQVRAGGEARNWLANERDVITIASAVQGEDDLYLNVIERALNAKNPPFFVYVPRAPERFETIAGMLSDRGIAFARRSEILSDRLVEQGVAPRVDVLIGDSLGEMYAYIAMSNLVVTGGGFQPKGAHNIIEPLALRRPVIVGPVVHTIEYPFVEAEAAGVCLRVLDEAGLYDAISGGLAGPDAAQIEAFFEVHSGATERTLEAIRRMVR